MLLLTGFKTIAFTAIDLSGILQKTFSNDLPLFFFDNKMPLNTANLQNLTSSDNSQQIIGSLKILGLSSMPLESLELENNHHFSLNYSQIGRHNTENEASTQKNMIILVSGLLSNFLNKIHKIY